MNLDRNTSASLLTSTDWNAEWMRLQEKRRQPDDPAWWDARAKHFRPKETSPYAQEFLALAGVRPGERVLDMGCGSGTLAVPLALAGHDVIAADFSQRMLDELQRAAREADVFAQPLAHAGQTGESARIPAHGDASTAATMPYAQLGSIALCRLAWDDDWAVAGLGEKRVDVALASRSLATHDMRAALLKLERTARRRCCVTLACNAGPRYDATVLDAVGVSVGESVDYLYAFNILAQARRAPEVRYLDSYRKDTFNTLEEGVADFARMLEHGHEDKVPALRRYLAAHMVENSEAGQPGPKGKPQGRYTLDHERLVRWAFISWEPLG